eukprot:1194656-Rhodomonas_salina.2
MTLAQTGAPSRTMAGADEETRVAREGEPAFGQRCGVRCSRLGVAMLFFTLPQIGRGFYHAKANNKAEKQTIGRLRRERRHVRNTANERAHHKKLIHSASAA